MQFKFDRSEIVKFKDVLIYYSLIYLMLGGVISVIGDRINQMASIALITHYEPGSGFSQGKLLGILALPVLIFGPFVGTLVDRWNRKWVLILSDFIRAVFVGLIPLFQLIFPGLTSLFVIIFIVYFVNIFFGPARSAIIPDIVKTQHLITANTFIAGTALVSTIFGFTIGGLIVERVGYTTGFYIDSLTFILSGVIMLKMKPLPNMNFSPRVENRFLLPSLKELKNETKEGLNYLLRNKKSIWAIGTTLLLILIAGFAYPNGIILAQELSGTVAQGFGFLIGALSAGMVISVILIGKYGNLFSKHSIVGVCFFIVSISAIGLAKAGSFNHAMLWIFLAGITSAPLSVIPETLLQIVVPKEKRGRLFAWRNILVNLILAITALTAGKLGDIFSHRAVLFSISIFTVISATIVYISGRKVLADETN